MTATSDRRRGPQVGIDVVGWGQRSAFGSTRGWPWWAAVLLALGLSIIGAVIDMHFSGNLAKVFDAAYFIGCVGAVCLVRRRNVFGPMVQAPLILAVTVPVVVLVTKGMPTSPSMASKLIALGVPLVTGFPTMAITTIATVLIGGIRFLVQRKPAGADVDEDDVRSSRGSRDDARRRTDRVDRADRVDRGERADRVDRGDRADRDGDIGERGRPGADRRARPAGAGRPGQDRASQDRASQDRAGRDDRAAAPRDRTRMQPSSGRSEADRGSRGEAPNRGSRGETPDRGGRGEAADRGSRGEAADRGSRSSRDEAADHGGRAGSGRSSADRDRGQAPRSQNRDRDRAQQQRGTRRDDGRRQPPRRDDDY